MKKIKTFLHVVINSLFPSEHYYKKIAKTRFLFSLKYFFALIFVLNFILISTFVFRNLFLNNNLTEFKASLVKGLDNYPSNLIITIKNNRLTTNSDRPYIFWLNYQNVPHPLVAIDERATEEKIYQFDSTTILINSDGIIRRMGNGLRYYPFKIKGEFTINKQRVENLKNLILRFFELAPFLILIIFIILFIVLFLFFLFTKIFYLAIISLIGFWAIKVFHVKTKYKKIFQISLHSNTIPVICEFAILILAWRVRFFHWYLFLTLVFFAAAIYETYFYQATLKISPKTHHKKLPHRSHSTR